MGGTLRLQSQLERGTTFFFHLTFPRPAAVSELLAPAAAAKSYEGLRGLRVLVAEDNPINQWIAVAVLENQGVRVEAVGDGTAALARLRANVYDAAILDIKMPGLSGMQVTVAIRSYPDARHAQLPIIALTANAFNADRAAYMAAGMNATLTKPYEEDELCQLLLRVIQRPPGAETEEELPRQ